jgi:hypothetical protein
VRPISSALKAGWICFGLGLLLSWFFALANVFFSIAIVSAVVAMCTHQVNRGLALLLTSFVGMLLCAILFFALAVGTVAVAAAPAIRQADSDLKRMRRQQEESTRRFAAANRQLRNAAIPGAMQQPNRQNPAGDPRSNLTAASGLRQPDGRAQHQHQLATQQQWAADQQQRRDDLKRQEAMREAQRQRDAVRWKEQRLELLQQSIDWHDKHIQRMRGNGSDWRVFAEPRDRLLQEKAKLQGY